MATKKQKVKLSTERGFLLDLTGRMVKIKNGLLYEGSVGTVIECWPAWGVTVRLLDSHGLERTVQYTLKEIELVEPTTTEDQWLQQRYFRLGQFGRQVAESDRLFEAVVRRRRVLQDLIRKIQRCRWERLGVKPNTVLVIWKGGQA